jgi:hypothetical protein
MNDPRGNRADPWLEALLERTRVTVRAPRGFASRVMDVAYKESLAGAPLSTEGAGSLARPRLSVSGLYRRLGWSFMLTAAVLAGSLLLPHAAYPTLIKAAAAEAALGAGPSAAVQGAIAGAGEIVQGALGEKQIGGINE